MLALRTATLDALALLGQSGFECQAFCNTRIDAAEEVVVEELLAKRGMRYVVRNAQIGAFQGRMIFTSHDGVPITLFNSASTRGGWSKPEEIAAFLSGCEIFHKSQIRNPKQITNSKAGKPKTRPSP